MRDTFGPIVELLLFSVVIYHEKKINLSACRFFLRNLPIRSEHVHVCFLTQIVPVDTWNAVLTTQPKNFSPKSKIFSLKVWKKL